MSNTSTLARPRTIMRMVSIREKTANPKTKSVEVVIATENPVERVDPETEDVVREILAMDGVEFRGGKNQLPIVDSHDRSTVRNVLGSVRNIRVDGTELIGDAVFAHDADSQNAFRKLMDGHLTDFSITAEPRDVQVIQRGETQVIRGQEITGPAHYVSRWSPTDASLVAAGADETSTVRELLRAYKIKRSGQMSLNSTIKKALIEHGMPDQIDDPTDALSWMLDQQRAEGDEEELPVEEEELIESAEDEEELPMAEEAAEEEEERADDEIVVDDEELDEEDEPEVKERVKRALVTDRKRRREIVALCKKAGLQRSFADSLCNRGVSISRARVKVLEKMVKSKPIGTSAGAGDRIDMVSSRDDKFYNAVRDGIISRAMVGVSRRPAFEGRKPTAGYQDFERMGLRRIAEEILRRGGVDVNRLTPQQIAMVAMGHKPTISRMKYSGIMRAGEAYHTTGIFPNLLLDAANKTLLAGYDEHPGTWQMWGRQAPSVPDFKEINRIRFSESPDLLVVPENKDYAEGPTSDYREKYVVEKFGRLFTVSWETVVNDDLDAISRIPAMHGSAARRTQNRIFYAALTANAAMADGVALFHSTHSNLDASGAPPSVAELNAAYTAMRTQTGLDGSTIINVTPQFLIVPAALEATAYQLIGSIADPSTTTATNEDAARAGFNSGTTNIYGPQGPRRLTVIAEPELDGNSATAWYLAASNSSIDTIELSYLQGEESPVLENEWNLLNDTYTYKIRQTFGVKPIDWRGMWKNPGT